MTNTNKSPPQPAPERRREWSKADKLNIALEVVTKKRTEADACKHYGVQSNQLMAWIGQAVSENEPRIASALAARITGGLVGVKIKLGERWLAEQGLQDRDEGQLLAEILNRELERSREPPKP